MSYISIIIILFFVVLYFFLKFENEKKSNEIIKELRQREINSHESILRSTLQENKKKEKIDAIINLERTPYSVIQDRKKSKYKGLNYFNEYSDLYSYETSITNNYETSKSRVYQSTEIIEDDNQNYKVFIFYSFSEYEFINDDDDTKLVNSIRGSIKIKDFSNVDKNELIKVYFDVKNGFNKEVIL